MSRRKADACMQHVVDFTDHAGRPAKLIWSDQADKVLPPLTNLCFYFVHPEFNLDNFNFTALRRDVLARADEQLRLEIFCIPGGTDADCADHYRKELEARGDLLEQVREVERAENDPEYAATRRPEAKLPGLVSSHSSLSLAYHGLVFVYRDATWNRDDDEQTIDVVQFDPDLRLEPGETIKPQTPLRTTQVLATTKAKVVKYEDQGVWVWFHDHMPRHWWYPALHATFGAQGMGWTSCPSSISTHDPKETCDSEEYVIKKSDTCQSVSKSQNVATSLLLRDNNLQAFCANFPKEGETLCIKNKCKIHVVDKEDTCASIASAARISQVQLYTWNPILGVSCRNIAKSVGDTICLEPPGDDNYTPPRTSLAATTTSTTLPSAAPVPSDISNGTTEVCAQYYRVETGDYCNKIIVKYTITLDDFLFLNQGINKNCTNLFAKESYCVEPVGPIEKYPDHADYVPPFTTVSEIRFDDLPEATFKIPRKTDSPKKLPLAKGTRKDCYIYVDGSDLHTEDSWVFDESECKKLAGTWRITLEELQSWNPSLNTSSESCEMDVKYRYCMKAHKSNGNSPVSTNQSTAPSSTKQPTKTETSVPAASSTEFPIRDGAIESCKEYKPFRAPHTCQDMLDDNNITIKQFSKWNPAVGAECGNLLPGYRYCVKA